MRIFDRIRVSSTVTVLCLVLSSCGGREELVPVAGQVKYRGQPLTHGSVMFQPRGGGGLARGSIEADGSFVLTTSEPGDGVKPGVCRVRITSFQSQRADSATDAQNEPTLGKSAIPRKYQNFGTSGLEINVESATDSLLIELE